MPEPIAVATHARTASATEPITEAVKYSFSFPPLFALPRFVLKITLPPMPMRRPRLYIMFQTGATTASAAVPCGP